MIDRNSPEPLYLQVKNDIAAQIEAGTIKIGDKLMSENEMMQYYNVGRVTIRNALSALTVTGCLKKEQGLGTFCVAKPASTKRLNIDVVMNCSDTYLVAFLLAGINSILEKEDCDLLLHDTKNSIPTVNQILQNILKRGTDGVILHHPNSGQSTTVLLQTLDLFRQLNIPVVSVCSNQPGTDITLTIDDCYGAKIAAQYLLDCGHRRILGLFPEEDYGVEDRFNSIKSVIEKHPDTIFHSLRSRNVAEDASEIIRHVHRNRITAIICYNDFYAVQCMHVLQEHGCRIPEDISLIGFDDSSLSTSAVPQLTTVSHPKDHMGSDAARSLLHRIHETMTTPSKTIYRPELVIRQSVLDMSGSSGEVPSDRIK